MADKHENGCSHCAAIDGSTMNKGSTIRKTQVQFEEELEQVSPSITVIGKYVSNKVKVKGNISCKKSYII